jgi:hypothetical protein
MQARKTANKLSDETFLVDHALYRCCIIVVETPCPRAGKVFVDKISLISYKIDLNMHRDQVIYIVKD